MWRGTILKPRHATILQKRGISFSFQRVTVDSSTSVASAMGRNPTDAMARNRFVSILRAAASRSKDDAGMVIDDMAGCAGLGGLFWRGARGCFGANQARAVLVEQNFGPTPNVSDFCALQPKMLRLSGMPSALLADQRSEIGAEPGKAVDYFLVGHGHGSGGGSFFGLAENVGAQVVASDLAIGGRLDCDAPLSGHLFARLPHRDDGLSNTNFLSEGVSAPTDINGFFEGVHARIKHESCFYVNTNRAPA